MKRFNKPWITLLLLAGIIALGWYSKQHAPAPAHYSRADIKAMDRLIKKSLKHHDVIRYQSHLAELYHTKPMEN